MTNINISEYICFYPNKNKYETIFLNSNNYTIVLYNYKNKTDYVNRMIILQKYKFYFTLFPCDRSSIYYSREIYGSLHHTDDVKAIIRTHYISNIYLNQDIIYLNLYFIYMILKYYLHKKISYFYSFVDGTKTYKKYNTMKIYKMVALII